MFVSTCRGKSIGEQRANKVGALAILLVIVVLPVGAQTVPTLINYQGRLVDGNGVPLETSNRDLEIRIYDAAEDGSLIYGPQSYPAQPVVNGYYNVLLGPADDVARSIEDAFDGPERYLEVRVAGAAIVPRQRVLSAPFAIHSKTAEVAKNLVAGVNHAYSEQSGGVNSSDTTFSEYPNLEVTLSTSGHPVWLALEGVEGDVQSEIYVNSIGLGSAREIRVYIRVLRYTDESSAGTIIYSTLCQVGASPNDTGFINIHFPVSVISLLDVPPTGTHRWVIETRQDSGNTDFHRISAARLHAVELGTGGVELP